MSRNSDTVNWEQDDVVMAEISGTAARVDGTELRMSMAEVFRMQNGLIAERRAWVIPPVHDDVR